MRSNSEGSSFSGLFTRVAMLCRVADEKIVRIRFDTQPAVITSRFMDRGHTVVDFAHEFVGRHGNDGEGSLPVSRVRIAPILPHSR
jgi:hypothetical protein